ncbi:MAG TPA: hypothetical protein VNT25_04295 [Allosphingosinicella sp.]|nr:hypothetical protein [Allosphingosinicella sp.]
MLITKTLSVTTKALVAAGICLSSTAAMANPACALSVQGCVLPVGTPAPVAVTTTTPVMVEDVAAPKSFPLIPLLGLALAGLAAYLILDDDDSESP